MSMSDPVADMFTRIRNAQKAQHKFVDVPYSKFKHNILNVLKEEGYVEDFNMINPNEGHASLKIDLKYYQNKPVIERIDKVSKPGLRKYSAYQEMRAVPGYGISIISTSKGVMSHKKARTMKLGGEVIGVIS